MDIKKYKAVIYLYQDCYAQFKNGDGSTEIDKVVIVSYLDDGGVEIWGKDFEAVHIEKVKLILKPMSKITEKQKAIFRQCFGIEYDTVQGLVIWHKTPDYFLWSIANGFDIYNLIEAGFAEDYYEVFDTNEWVDTKPEPVVNEIKLNPISIPKKRVPRKDNKDAEFSEKVQRIKRG